MGADAVGFVFAPSPRQIAPQQAGDIAKRLPAEIVTVGVFRDETRQRVVDIAHRPACGRCSSTGTRRRPTATGSASGCG